MNCTHYFKACRHIANVVVSVFPRGGVRRNLVADLRRLVRKCGVKNSPEGQASLLISADIFTSSMGVFHIKFEDILLND